MKPTMDDIAQRVGVSKSTVSLALNDKPGVSTELRQTIVEAAEELGYRLPDSRAVRRASPRKSITIVHCEGYGDTPSEELAALYLEYIDGINEFLSQMDVNLTLIAGHHDTSDQRQLGSRLLDSGRTSCDGYIVMGLGARRCSALIDQLQGEDVPIVVLSRQWPDVMVSTVSQDHRQQIKLVMDYLMRLGHRRIAFVAREEDRYYDWFEWRLEAFRQAMAQLNGGMDDDLVSVGADGAVAVRTVLERCPDVTAVFGVNDGRAVEAMQGLSALGLRIPHDVSVIGVDDTTRPPAPFPPLTTVTYPHAEMGFLAAELLLKQIENRSILCTNMVVRSHLVERASCARARS